MVKSTEPGRIGSDSASPRMKLISGYPRTAWAATCSVALSRSSANTRMRRPSRRAQRTSAHGMSPAPVPTSSTVMVRDAGRSASRRFTWVIVIRRPPNSALRREMSFMQHVMSANGIGTGPSMSSSTPSARASGGRKGMLPAQQGSLGGEARPEGDHEAPISRYRFTLLEQVVEHEDDSGGGHVAVVLQHVARVRELALLERHEAADLLDHAPARRVQDEVRDVVLLQPLRGHERLGHLGHHGRADAPHVLREHHPRPPARILEAHRAQVLRAEDGPDRK